MTKTFILGVGAQKAGTSWLHDYFCGIPGFDPGFEKEYHILDARYLTSGSRYRMRNLRCGLRSGPALLLKRAAGVVGIPLERRHNEIDWARLSLMRSDAAYVGYFSDILSKPGVTHTADITPEYASLPVNILKSLGRQFAERGVHVRAIFLMRDPVERIWSASRMFVRQHEAGRFAGPSGQWLEPLAAVEELCGRAETDQLARYEQTVANLEEAFGHDNVHLEMYERLFDISSLRRITEFFGMPFVDPDFSRRVNSAPDKMELSPDIANSLKKRYSATYDFLDTRFPGWRGQPDVWSQSVLP